MRIYPEVTVDKEFKDLGDLGFDGSLNDRQYAFLKNRGLSGSLADMMYSFRFDSFSPLSLFANGEAGVWYDPSPDTCFTDTAGTTPAGEGDAVARVNDLSGNGNHATQATVAARPTLEKTAGGLWYLDFDGVDDQMSFSHGIAGTDDRAIFAGLDLDAEGGAAGQDAFLYLGGEVSKLGDAWSLHAESAGFALRVGGNTVYDEALDLSPVVVSHYWGLSLGATNDDAVARKNGVELSIASSSNQTINTNGGVAENGLIGNALGTAGGFLDGKMFSLVVVKKIPSASEITGTEGYVAGKAGVTL